jgi:mannose-6-phosphate isomerase-like protein (cupin superfamily)
MAGHTFENPISKERFTSTACGADRLCLEVRVPPDMIRPPVHVHRHQQESFQVIDGRVTVRAGRDQHILGPGDRLTVAAGTAHTFWNSGDSDVTLQAEFRPPGNMMSFFETFCGMAAEGRCGSDGGPPFLQIAASARDWDMYIAGPPVPLQKLLFAALRPVARRRGYRSSYDRFAARRP